MNSLPNLTNCLLGGALGDSIGLPAAGIPAKRIARLWPGPLPHRFLFSNGMVKIFFFLIIVLIHGFRRLLPPY